MNNEQIIGNTKALLELSGVKSYEQHVQALEVLREPLLNLRIVRYKELCEKREQFRHPKDKDLTDFDRKTMLEAAVADVQAEYELAAGLEKLVAERVELIKILIKDK